MLINSPKKIKLSIINLFNFSLLNGVMPDIWKKAKIKMIHKTGKDKKMSSSYRPISLLSNLGKLLEKIINTRLANYLEANNLISIHQSGFRKNRSTKDHILRLIQGIKANFNQNKLTGAVFFDVSKAFDQTWHKGILFKMTELKLPSFMISWVENFLKNRNFFVSFGNYDSELGEIDAGVPQGSSISPTLFSIYISDIDKIELNKTVNVALYADDICIWYSSKCKIEITHYLQIAIDYILRFFQKWCLNINISKTAYTVFTTAGCRSSYIKLYSLNLTINGQLVTLDPFPKLLGISFDPKLSFFKHINEIGKKAMSKIQIIRILKSKIKQNNNKFLIVIYKSLVRSLLDYSDIILATASASIISNVQKIQNRVLRICMNPPFQTSTISLHTMANIETVKDRSLALAKSYLKKAITVNELVKNLFSDYEINKEIHEGSMINGRTPCRTPLSIIA